MTAIPDEGRHLLLSTKEGVLLEVDGPIKRRFGNAQGLDGTRIEEAQAVQSFAGGPWWQKTLSIGSHFFK